MAVTAPVTPPEFKAVISDPSSSMCGNFVNTLLKLPVLVYQMMSWLFNATGNPSKNFRNCVLPPGAIFGSACLQTEDGLLLCDGREVSRTEFADLFAAIGVTYGTPSGSTTFKIPDYRAKFPVGIGTFDNAGAVSLGVAAGQDQVTIFAANLPKHHHYIANADTGDGSALSSGNYLNRLSHPSGSASTDYLLEGSATQASIGQTSDVGSDTPTPKQTVPPYLGWYMYIVA